MYVTCGFISLADRSAESFSFLAHPPPPTKDAVIGPEFGDGKSGDGDSSETAAHSGNAKTLPIHPLPSSSHQCGTKIPTASFRVFILQ